MAPPAMKINKCMSNNPLTERLKYLILNRVYLIYNYIHSRTITRQVKHSSEHIYDNITRGIEFSDHGSLSSRTAAVFRKNAFKCVSERATNYSHQLLLLYERKRLFFVQLTFV